jgi:hypothetical protein
MWDMIERMSSDRLWLYTALAGSIFGAIFVAYISTTRLGLWCYSKIDIILDILIVKLGWSWLQQPKEVWRTKLPAGLIKKIDDMETRIKHLEK